MAIESWMILVWRWKRIVHLKMWIFFSELLGKSHRTKKIGFSREIAKNGNEPNIHTYKLKNIEPHRLVFVHLLARSFACMLAHNRIRWQTFCVRCIKFVFLSYPISLIYCTSIILVAFIVFTLKTACVRFFFCKMIKNKDEKFRQTNTHTYWTQRCWRKIEEQSVWLSLDEC